MMSVPNEDNPTTALRQAFRAAFDADPTHLSRAPGRINILGEHIDYAGGVVLPMAIEQAARCAIRFTDHPGQIRLRAVDRAESFTTSVRHGLTPPSAGAASSETGHWSAYVLGVIAQVLGEHPPRLGSQGLDLAFTSTIPIGAGLSSSAGIELAVAFVLRAALGLGLSDMELARRCRDAEHRYARVPCGLMDQAASALCRAGHVLELDCRSETHRHLPLPDELRLIVLDTRVRHQLAQSGYTQRRAACEQACSALGVDSPRELVDRDVASLVHSLPDDQSRAITHAVTEMRRVADFIKALHMGDAARLGTLMNESHESLRSALRVSCRELDLVAQAARETPGVLGARMTGGGFGGCVIALTTEHEAESAAVRIPPACPGVDPAAFIAAPAPGASAWAC